MFIITLALTLRHTCPHSFICSHRHISTLTHLHTQTQSLTSSHCVSSQQVPRKELIQVGWEQEKVAHRGSPSQTGAHTPRRQEETPHTCNSAMVRCRAGVLVLLGEFQGGSTRNSGNSHIGAPGYRWDASQTSQWDSCLE